MKKYAKWLLTTVLSVWLLTGLTSNIAKAQPGYISFQTFYDDLSPYGEWIYEPQYGYVWVPDVQDNDFRPYYSNGHWIMTEYGNTWVSDYDWGWAPFHYGRWTYDGYYGWVWVPDYEWGPAWVSWRSGGGYYGWAPLAPGISISVSFGGGFYMPNDWWIFIPCGHIYEHNYHHYYRGPRYNPTYINHTTIIHNTHVYNHVTYTTGPRINDVQHYVGGHVNVYHVQNTSGPRGSAIHNNNLQIFRPEVQHVATNNMRPRSAIRAERNIGKPEPISTNNGRPRGAEILHEHRNEPQQARQEIQQPQRIENNRQEPPQRERAPRQEIFQQPNRMEQRQPVQQPNRTEQQQPQHPEQRPQPTQQPNRSEPRQTPVFEQRRPVQQQPSRTEQRQPQRFEQRPEPAQQQRFENRSAPAPRTEPAQQKNEPARSSEQSHEGRRR